jgi:L,D-transpeptidase catalytic domain
MAHFPVSQRFIRKGAFALVSAMLVMLSLSACGGDPQAQQQASQNKSAFDNEIAHAQSIGIPASMLTPITNQATQLNATNAPVALFNDQSITGYNSNLAARYQMLTLETRGLEAQATQQLDYQSSQDLQTLATALAVRQGQKFIEAKTFANQLTDDQAQLAKAQLPKDYIQISSEAKSSTLALHLMEPAYNDLTSLQQVIKQLQASHLDTTALNLQAQGDLQTFRGATGPGDFSQLIDQINTQIQETTVYSIQAIPFVGAVKVKQFSDDINQLKTWGVNTAAYQPRLTADQQALTNAKDISGFLKVSAQIDRDMASIQFPLAQGQANYLLKQFHQEVTNWGNAHQYHDSYDGGVYNLDYEYDLQGIGYDADAAAQSAQTLDDYRSVIDLLNSDFLHLRALEADYHDKTAWDHPHATDISLMQHYGVSGSTGGQVLVVSLIEQTVRYYNNGKLVRSFQVVTGQYLKPSVPGFWSIFVREHPTEFKSSEPPGSAFWYPPTPIQYAMEYHSGGYFFHDSWWRGIYGQGMNFPHSDPSGTTSFNGNGSHGCINMNPNDVAWLYSQIPWGTPVIVY